MSTPCLIAIHTDSGYLATYCHHDGYRDHMLKILTTYYNTDELAHKLISMGDASCIYENLEPKGPHSFEKPESRVCVFYHRDRGEDWEQVKPELYYSIEQLKWIQPWVYVWETDHWEEAIPEEDKDNG